MKVTNEFENKLIGRKEVKGSLRAGESDVTMTRESLRNALAKKYKTKEELIVVSKIAPHFGDSAVTFSANIYEKEEAKKAYELEHMIKRNKTVKPEATPEASNDSEAQVAEDKTEKVEAPESTSTESSNVNEGVKE